MSKTLLPQEGRVLLIARLSDGTEYRIGEVSQYKVSETRETRLVECLGSNPPSLSHRTGPRGSEVVDHRALFAGVG